MVPSILLQMYLALVMPVWSPYLAQAQEETSQRLGGGEEEGEGGRRRRRRGEE